MAWIIGRRTRMTKFAVERTVPDWTGYGLSMAEVLDLKLANERTVLKDSRKANALTLAGKEEEWEVFDSLGQKKTKKWRGYFENGERKYCTMQRSQTLWTLIDDLAQKEMMGMFAKLGGSKVPRQWHKQILQGVAGDRKVIKKEMEKIQWNEFRIGISTRGNHLAGQLCWQWKVINGAVVFDIFSSWGYAQVSLRIFKDHWGVWDFAVESFNNKWNGR